MTRGDRLDSWKAIATYLNRDERTVRRWEKTLGLPVRRVPGGRGHSVFALTSEVDAWLLNRDVIPEPGAVSSGRPPRSWRVPATVAAGAALTLLAVWWTTGHVASAMPGRVDLTPSAIVAFDRAGVEQWQFPFPGERVEVPDERGTQPVEMFSQPPGILTAIQVSVSTATEVVRGGKLLALTPAGALRRSFAFDDRLTFGAGDSYGSPWGITDFRVNGAGPTRLIALVAHHYQWWPSMVTVLDEEFHRRGTFVNAGWLERVHWIAPDRLLVAGFSEARDGGVVALLDPNALDGQSPEQRGSRFYCQTCGDARPLRYIVMPRSELNLATGSRFNRARIEVNDKGVTVRTLETKMTEEDAIDALYEFSPSLDVVSASFSERYWEEHRALETQGKITHTREECPGRDGPRTIEVWEPQSGWKTVKIR